MLTPQYWGSTVTEKTILNIHKRRCYKHEACFAPSQWKYSSASFLFSSPVPPRAPSVWNKHLQWFHWELTGMGKRSTSSNAFKNAFNIAVRPSQPAMVKVMFTMWFESTDLKERTGISLRALLSYHKGFANHKATCPRYLRHAEIMFPVTLLI